MLRSGLLLIILVAVMPMLLTGCLKKWELEEIQELSEIKPTDYDDCMRVARAKAAEGKTDRAMQIYQTAMADIEGQFGPDDLRIATSADELGTLQERLGMNPQAEESFRKAFNIRLKKLPEKNPDLKACRQKLAAVLRKLFKEEEAQQVLYGVAPSAGSNGGKTSDVVRTRRRHRKP
ncbi:MAG: tetratricopeptide repeat protein [Candidatus Obscuribacterales bacterium]|nr:tetratricopeptide repeat protein [Candidatus Obscuribacterales bacterium]